MSPACSSSPESPPSCSFRGHGRRPDVGRLPRRPDVPLGRKQGGRAGPGAGQRGVDHANGRRMVEGGSGAPASATDPFDPAYTFGDVDEFVRNAQERGVEVLITLWGTPGWANGGQKPQRCRGTSRTSRTARGRVALLEPLRGYLRPLLHDLERVESRDVPRAAVRLEGTDREPRELREARPVGHRGDPGGEQPRPGRDRRDVLERP